MIVEEWFENKLLKVVATGTVFVLDNARTYAAVAF
jgi:hypothetical protein